MACCFPDLPARSRSLATEQPLTTMDGSWTPVPGWNGSEARSTHLARSQGWSVVRASVHLAWSPLISSFPCPLTVLPGITSQINSLHPNPRLVVWKLRTDVLKALWKTVLPGCQTQSWRQCLRAPSSRARPWTGGYTSGRVPTHSSGQSLRGSRGCEDSVQRPLFQVIANICAEETRNCAVQSWKMFRCWRDRNKGAKGGKAEPQAWQWAQNSPQPFFIFQVCQSCSVPLKKLMSRVEFCTFGFRKASTFPLLSASQWSGNRMSGWSTAPAGPHKDQRHLVKCVISCTLT